MSQSDLEKGPDFLGSPTSRPSGIANPGSLGLFSFASTTLVLSLINVQARGVSTPNIVVGMAVFTGGLVQLLAGMWEFPRGNLFGATAFSSYGAFWMSYATILLPSSGIIESYTATPGELENAIGIYLVAWTIFTIFMLIASLQKHFTFIALFAFLTATFGVLTTGAFMANANVTKAGGVFGIITALIAYYCAMSELLVLQKTATSRYP